MRRRNYRRFKPGPISGDGRGHRAEARRRKRLLESYRANPLPEPSTRAPSIPGRFSGLFDLAAIREAIAAIEDSYQTPESWAEVWGVKP